MKSLRAESVKVASLKQPTPFENGEMQKDIFNTRVFTIEKVQKYLSKRAFDEFMRILNKGKKISRDLADQIAVAMKTWALHQGATHYTHWFQPLTGATAEKHDAFFELSKEGYWIENFDGNQLIQQEPDASSFPSGGIRNTFEARGYTAWDPTSPAFVYGKTLCIPTIFVSYTGEALDYKTPLLKSLHAIDETATEICKYFDKNVSKVNATLGWEQEYFLVDRALVATRPDLLLTGRTLLGHAPSKGQQLDDHYFGSIPSRVIEFMKELEYECIILGIPVKTRHNEVAPGQYELAPIYEEANLAVDHNLLLMDIMKRIAKKHDFEALFHEKPFDAINGSGKHNNWSLRTNTGVNLLSPGKTPMSNLQFLTFFVSTISGVLKHESLLRASVANAGNDMRLGANEAPPAIVSVFIGKQLSKVLDELEQVSKGKLSPEEKTDLKLNVVGKIPEILLDNTDRNRTSPFAFTGNKFEFRAVGAKANCAKPMTVLNTLVAAELKELKIRVDTLIEEKDIKKDDAIFNVLRDTIKEIKSILFEGDGYSDAWEKEAQKRGLSHNRNTPEALDAYLTKSSVALFSQFNIFSERELQARHQVDLEEYVKKIQIESRTLGDIARNHVIPTAIAYQNTLIKNAKGLKEIYGASFEEKAKEQMALIEEISGHISKINSEVSAMTEARKKWNQTIDIKKRAEAYCEKVLPYFKGIRYHCDKLELMIDDTLWPMAKYRELLFVN